MTKSKLINVLLARVGGSLLALLFVFFSPFVLDVGDIGLFFKAFSSLIFFSVLTRLGSEIYFFENEHERINSLVAVACLGVLASFFISMPLTILFDSEYYLILPIFTINWIFASYLKSINKPLYAQILEYYVMYSVLLAYLAAVYLIGYTRDALINVFVLSVFINFIVAVLLILGSLDVKKIKYKSVLLKIKDVLGYKTFQNILIMYGNYFVMWGPILLYSWVSNSIDEVGIFSLSYKYAASLMLLLYVVHSVFSTKLADKETEIESVLNLDIRFKQLFIVSISLVWVVGYMYGIDEIPELILYTLILVSAIALYIAQSFKVLYLTYRGEKKSLLMSKIIFFMILGLSTLCLSIYGLTEIFYFNSFIVISYLILYVIIEYVFKRNVGSRSNV